MDRKERVSVMDRKERVSVTVQPRVVVKRPVKLSLERAKDREVDFLLQALKKGL